MLKNATKAMGALMAGVVIATCAAGTASATNQVACAGRYDFVSVFSTNGVEYCFANGGDLDTAIPARIVGSGNNRVQFTFSNGNRITLFKEQYAPTPGETVVHIRVF